MLTKNTNLTTLDLTNTAIMNEGDLSIFTNIPKTIKYLYMVANAITFKGCQTLPHSIPYTNLETLLLGCNRIGDKVAEYIAVMLEHVNCPLLSLVLSSCAIGPNGIAKIAKALESSTTRLGKLNLGLMKSRKDLGEIPNEVGSEGAIDLAKMLKRNTTLRYLDTTYTSVVQVGITALAQAIIINKTLVKFNVEQFGIPHNELHRKTIRAAVNNNMMKLTADEKMKSTII